MKIYDIYIGAMFVIGCLTTGSLIGAYIVLWTRQATLSITVTFP